MDFIGELASAAENRVGVIARWSKAGADQALTDRPGALQRLRPLRIAARYEQGEAAEAIIQILARAPLEFPVALEARLRRIVVNRDEQVGARLRGLARSRRQVQGLALGGNQHGGQSASAQLFVDYQRQRPVELEFGNPARGNRPLGGNAVPHIDSDSVPDSQRPPRRQAPREGEGKGAAKPPPPS